MKEHRKSPLSGMGGITVFMVLAVLTVAVFSVLTLTTAVADTNLSQKNADLVTAYYKADALGVDLLAALAEAWPQGSGMPGEAQFQDAARRVIPDLELTVWLTEDQALFVCSFQVDQRRHMEIDAALNRKGSPRWDISKWVFLPAESGEVDDSLPVWQMG